MTSPSRLSRESTTRSSTAEQNGHFIPNQLTREGASRSSFAVRGEVGETFPARRARREKGESDDRDRDERDRVGDERDAGRRRNGDVEDLRQRELHGRVVTADASRCGHDESENGGRRDDVGGRKRKRESE